MRPALYFSNIPLIVTGWVISYSVNLQPQSTTGPCSLLAARLGPLGRGRGRGRDSADPEKNPRPPPTSFVRSDRFDMWYHGNICHSCDFRYSFFLLKLLLFSAHHWFFLYSKRENNLEKNTPKAKSKNKNGRLTFDSIWALKAFLLFFFGFFGFFFSFLCKLQKHGRMSFAFFFLFFFLNSEMFSCALHLMLSSAGLIPLAFFSGDSIWNVFLIWICQFQVFPLSIFSLHLSRPMPWFALIRF